MAVAFLGRVLIPKQSFSSLTSRFISSTSSSVSDLVVASRSPLFRLRPLIALSEFNRVSSSVVGLRAFSSRPTTSSLNDPSPNWNNRPPKETILLDGCDFEHWLIVLEKPEGDPTRDEIIDSYIKTLAMVLGSEEEARKNIYSVSTRHYFAFGALVSEEVSYKIKELPRVRWVLPDSYLDVKNKDYGGEPFIDGQAVPYDPKYHEEWVRNNARANERSRRNDRPRNFDRSRNFERRRENMQSRDGPPPNMGGMQGGPPPNMGGMQGPPPNMGGMQGPPPNMGGMQGPPPNMGGMQGPRMPQNSYSQNSGPSMGGSPQNSYSQNPGPNMGGMPHMHNSPPNMGGMPPNPSMQNNGPYMGGAGPNAGYSNQMPNAGNGPNRDFQYNNNTGGGMPYQNRDAPPQVPQNAYTPNRDMGGQPGGNNAYQVRDIPVGGQPGGNNAYQVRDIPGRDAPQVPQNAYTPNRDMGGQPGGNNVYQVRDIPGRDMPPNPNQNRDY